MANNKKMKADLLAAKEKELEQKNDRLAKIPLEVDKINNEAGMQERNLNLMKKKIELQMKYPGIVNPNFVCEKTQEWQDMINDELKLRLEKVTEDLVALGTKKAELLKQLSDQEARINDDKTRIMAEIAKLK
jgi:hypothetical protein